MNMLMIAPLCDSRGKIRYFIGAQVDVSGLVKECTDMETLTQLINKERAAKAAEQSRDAPPTQETKDDFQELSEMLNMAELDTVRKYGGRMHREYQDDDAESRPGATHMSRLLLQEPSAGENLALDYGGRQSGRLSGIYQNVSLKRRYQPKAMLINLSTSSSDHTHRSVFFLLLQPCECLAFFSLPSWTRLAAQLAFAVNFRRLLQKGVV